MGQFDSNLLSNALLPGFLFTFYQLITNDCLSSKTSIEKPKVKTPSPSACTIIFLLISFIALVGSQTNAIFSAGVICIPLIVNFLGKLRGVIPTETIYVFSLGPNAWSNCKPLAISVFLPFIQPIVSVYREPTATPLEAIKNILLLNLENPPMRNQYLDC